MEKLVINGLKPLKGEVVIGGAKNSAIALLPASLLIKGICTITNVPNIVDVKLTCQILEALGSKITWKDNHTLVIDNTNITNTNAPLDLTSKFRASYYLIGSMLGRAHKVEVGLPGGCNLGPRPIDQHLKGFEALGCTYSMSQGKINLSVEKLKGNSVYLDVTSVGATINILLAAVLAQGTTVIENAAKEPHVVDVANFLISAGADIKGAGTNTIKINGVKELLPNITYSVVPDQIEAGTFMLAAVATKGDILIKNCVPEHLDSLNSKIIEIGATLQIDNDSIRVTMDKRPDCSVIKTLPYPGFPTDLQSQIGAVLAVANGTSIITESIWDSRFQYTAELNKMGAKIIANGKTAVIEGVSQLYGAPVFATDLRAGAALIIAALSAKGTSEIYNLSHIDRGYENIEDKFISLGAEIKRIKE